ncbi:tRNA pseudouridine synthase A [Bombiscardovia apis]|uniref:tRNA pseudouridine synthase A n=1 Tax=Bombiscardovia apis TaxID=2932182 RepID=A0ABM8BDX9_9BIFI|nr:tRNA pseudouridine(38-40) synthase TruA [Bombiscardovia apis]BDR55129.1 tRNA pseudouridine synthase A [Bombiscardovia apis]
MEREIVRLRIDLAYEGTHFYGWARQRELRTVQGEIERALCKVLHLSSPARTAISEENFGTEAWKPQLVVAGRTDTGVHASHQVCHLDIPHERLAAAVGHMDAPPVLALERRIQHVVPRDIAIHSVKEAPSGFDARFSALERTYVYRVCDDLSALDPRLRSFVLPISTRLDVDSMNQAAATTIGLHDFGSFATPNPGGTTIRKVKYAHWDRVPSRPLIAKAGGAAPAYETPVAEAGLVCFTIVADAFARNMVRSLVNGCLKVGTGKRSLDWFHSKIEQPVREGSTGPIEACGLTLEQVAYPPDNQLAIRAQAIRAKRTLP